MERIPTRPAPLVRNLPIRSYDGVANSALSLSFQRALDVPSPCAQRINQAAVEDSDSAQTSAQPRLPLLLIDGDTVETLDVRIR